MKQDMAQMVALTRNLLEEQRRQGVQNVRLNPNVLERLEKIAPEAKTGRQPTGLDALAQRAAQCVKCNLHKTRTHVVFGEGNPNARLMFVGEAPGEEEDVQGRPFVGRAGQLLTRIIEAMGLSRDEVYIANILKCRPPGNRGPLPEEIACCVPYLTEQIEIIQPRIICALGAYAAQTLLGSREGIKKLRGKFYDYRGIKLMPTFHPSACLRNPGTKKYVWEDMKQVRAEYAKTKPKI